MNQAKFITVEGIDGAGKSSHLSAIADWIKSHGHTVIETREPGGTALGETLRTLILHQTMSPMTELLTVFAARAQHLEQLIEPALQRGDWVVCDRFTDSTRAYQGAGRGLDSTVIEQLAQLTHAHCNPDLTLIFDIDLAQATSRIQNRLSTLAESNVADKFETAPSSFTHKVQAAYRGIATAQSHRCVLIDGGQSFEAVRSDVLSALRERLGNNV